MTNCGVRTMAATAFTLAGAVLRGLGIIASQMKQSATPDAEMCMLLGAGLLLIGILMLVAEYLAAIGLKLFPSQRVKPVGCCQICGYDMRATPDRCPECGTVPKSPP